MRLPWCEVVGEVQPTQQLVLRAHHESIVFWDLSQQKLTGFSKWEELPQLPLLSFRIAMRLKSAFKFNGLTVPRKPAIPLFSVKDYLHPTVTMTLITSFSSTLNCERSRSGKVWQTLWLALGQLQEIEIKSAHYSHLCQAKVRFIQFIE